MITRNILDRNGSDAQHAIVYLFAIFTVSVLVFFIFLTNGILDRIATASNDASLLLDDWLELKSDLLIEERASGPRRHEAIAVDLAACAAGVGKVSAMPLLPAMRKLDQASTAERGLEACWQALQDGWLADGAAQAGAAGRQASIERRLALAEDFESALRGRIGLIARFERNQRSALVILQVASILAILSLVALGLWTSKAASRSHKDQARLRELIRATYAGQEAERARIALDLHDSIAQDIASSLMMARRLGETESGDKARLLASLKTSLDALRRISWELRPPELERLRFQGAAMRLIGDFEERNGFPVKVQITGPGLDHLGLEAELHLYRILQEALSNVSKHAKASGLEVSLGHEAGCVILSIADDGQGFDAAAVGLSGPAPEHMGLAGMRERARLIGGKLRVISCPGKGTTVEVEVPDAG